MSYCCPECRRREKLFRNGKAKDESYFRSIPDVPPIEGKLQSVLIGSMFGDGRITKPSQNSRYVEYHCAKQKDYITWKWSIWGSTWMPRGVYNPSVTPQKFPGYNISTINHPLLNDWHKLFYEEKGGHKRFHDKSLIDLFDPLALAIWYQDDGNTDWSPTFSFGLDEKSREIAFLVLEKFGFHPIWISKNSPTNGILTIRNPEESEKFYKLVDPWIVDCMKYKLNYLGINRELYLRRSKIPNSILSDISTGESSLAKASKELGVSKKSIRSCMKKRGFEYRSKNLRETYRSLEALNLLIKNGEKNPTFVDYAYKLHQSLGFPFSSESNIRTDRILEAIDKIKKYAPEGLDLPLDKSGLFISSTLMPHRYKIRHLGKLSAFEAFSDEMVLKQLIKDMINSGSSINRKGLLNELNFRCKTPGQFRPTIAYYLAKTYCPPQGKVFDPCAGWGGRLLGTLIADRNYVGVDQDSETCRCLSNLGSKIQNCLKDNKSVLIKNNRIQDVQIEPDSFDFAMTSPPYWNTEVYSPEENKPFSFWVEEFLIPTFEKTSLGLKTSGFFAINIKNLKREVLIPLEKETKQILEGLGFILVKTYRMKNPKSEEPIFIFQKVRKVLAYDKTSKTKTLEDFKLEEIQDYAKKQLTLREIRKRTGLSIAYISKVIKKHNIPYTFRKRGKPKLSYCPLDELL
jgi:hypothetical protein